MRHITGLALSGALALGLAAAGPAAAEQTLKMATIAPGTSAYLTMTTMANLVNQAQDEYEIQVDATGAATKHMIEVAEGKLDFSMTSPTVYKFMKNGTAMYSKLSSAPELAENLRLVFWFPYGAYHILSYAEDDIRTFDDIKGKRVFLGPPGGGAFNTAKRLLQAAGGLEMDEDYSSVNASWSAAFQGFQDRQIDVLIVGCVAPCPQVEQLTLTNKLRLVGLTQDIIDNAPDDMKTLYTETGRTMETIPAGVYGDGLVNTDDVLTIGSFVGVDARADLPEETVYTVTKAFWESVGKARESTPWLRAVTTDLAVRPGGMKLHPGALKYYEEAGIPVPEESK